MFSCQPAFSLLLKEMRNAPHLSREKQIVMAFIGCVVLVSLLGCLVLYLLRVWQDYRFENDCIYEGVRYQLGEYRPDGECQCLYGYTKQKWVWNCREAWGK